MQYFHPSFHERFKFSDWVAVQAKLTELGLTLPYSEDVACLSEPVELAGWTLPNALVIQPMEGCDSDDAGRPGELTFRRYQRFAAGGAGLIWAEATSILIAGRGNPHQLCLLPETADSFARLVEATHAAAGDGPRPRLVAQLQHSGRYSRPVAAPAPVIARHCPELDATHFLPPDYPILSDAELDALPELHASAARLAFEAGFDAVDLKACHGYLMHELLGAHTREGRYGGSFENRTRLLLDCVAAIRAEVPGLTLCTRLNVYDALPYPWGFGMDLGGTMAPDLTEPLALLRLLAQAGVAFFNLAYGNPYYNPHVERPYDAPDKRGYLPREHPLAGVALMCDLHRQVHEALPALPLIASGLSWLRQFSAPVAAGMVASGQARLAGLGRMALAYPDFPRDLRERGRLLPEKVCLTCSTCSGMMRAGGPSGCPVRDGGVYRPILMRLSKQT